MYTMLNYSEFFKILTFSTYFDLFSPYFNIIKLYNLVLPFNVIMYTLYLTLQKYGVYKFL